jgi:flagellar biosynthesis/type III secretory pathway protein FliH
MLSIDSGPAWIVALASAANVYLTHRNGKRSAQERAAIAKAIKDDSAKTEVKLDALHKSTNGLSERNEAIARKLGIAEGTATGLEQGREEHKEQFHD